MSAEFLITAFIVVLAPGTGVLYTLAVGLGRGRLAALVAALGCTLGIVPHMLAAILGFAALLHTSAVLFQIFKFVGALYLLYLALQVLRDKGAMRIEAQAQPVNLWRTARTGFLINILNPKLSIFFLAFLPQFVPVSAGVGTEQMVLLSLVFMVMTFVVFVGYGLFAAMARDFVLTRENVMRWFRRGVAAAFAAMGAKLALSSQS